MAINILVADDSNSMRRVLIKTIKMCKSNSFNFIQAKDGQEALEALDKEWIDIVFTDLNMPVMTGYELLNKMKEIDLLSTVPVIVITSETRQDILQPLIEMGAKGIVTKPFYPEEVCTIISNTLNINDDEGDDDDNDFEGFDF